MPRVVRKHFIGNGALGQDLFNDVTVHIRKTHISSTKTEGALGMLDSQQVEHSRMQVMDIPFVFDRLVPKVIRPAHTRTTLDPATRHPDGKAKWIVIAPISSLSERGTAKLSGPYDKGFIEHASGFEILNQPGDRLVDGQAVLVVPVHQVFVLVPSIPVATGAGQFDEANTPFD